MEEKLLGDYRILKQIGEGSLGATFLAEHRFIKKLYVLKVLPEYMASDRLFVERFEREVIRLASLDHPHLVKMHTVSCLDGIYFLVSDSFSGPNGEILNLTDYLREKKGKLSENELHSIASQIAGALDYAHSKKGGEPLAHLALKLSNVSVIKKGLEIEVALSDFGLAKIIGLGTLLAHSFKAIVERLNDRELLPYPIESREISNLSRSFMDSFAFYSPEQKRGAPASCPADVYSFGVLIYYLITSTFPEGSFSLPTEVASELDPKWDQLVLSCLQPRPEKRPTLIAPLLAETKKVSLAMPRPAQECAREMAEMEGLKTALTEEKSSQMAIAHEREKEKEMVYVHAASHSSATCKASAEPIASSTSSSSTISKIPAERESLIASCSEPSPSSVADRISVGGEPHVSPFHPEHVTGPASEPLLSEMRVIPAGTYMRGSNEGSRDEMPRHKILLNSFAIDIHPVTNEQFVRFLDFVGTEKDEHYNDLIRLKDSRISRHGGKYLIESGYAKHPVVGVTWYGADNYSRWVGRRLPTEAEWEIAAQGSVEMALFPTGESIDKNQANFFSSDTAPVMSYTPNGYGLYDMAGNVYEWCQDWYSYSFYEHSAQEPNNPKGPHQGVYRVLRGGCWKSLKEDLRCSHRHRNNPGTVTATYGFRTASDVYPT